MKDLVIGIVGGMGSYATLDFFNRILDAFPAEKEWDRPRIIIDNNCKMPSRVRAILYDENKEKLVYELNRSIELIRAGGGNKIILACNTSHYFLPEIYKINSEAKNYIIDIIDSCYLQCLNSKIKNVLLLATEGTLETKIYNNYFKDISLHYPAKNQINLIRYFIEIVKQNKIDDIALKEFNDFIEGTNDKNIILGCTELPVLYRKCLENDYKFSKNIIDPLEAVIEILKNY